MIETKTRVVEGLMAAEAAAFEKRLSRANPADAQWLLQVRCRGWGFRARARCASCCRAGTGRAASQPAGG